MTQERIARYPLQWPSGWIRTPPENRQKAAFASRQPDRAGVVQTQRITLNRALLRLQGEADLLGASNPVLSTNVVLRLDGQPRGGQAQPTDPGVALYFQLDGEDRCLACDKWNRVEDNVAALAAHIGALRGVDRWGVGTMAQAFRGYAALPPPAEDWRAVLGLPAGETTKAEIDTAYRALARKHHPDFGGDSVLMARINRARAIALAVLEKADA